MLQEAIDLQNRAVSELFASVSSEKENIIFKAPTGSGKTYMMAKFMNQVISHNNNVVFLVSTLSKGGLAEQNFDQFVEYQSTGNFPNLDPYLINTDTTEEERLFIPTDHNVYVLARDLYGKNRKLMSSNSLENFLSKLKEGSITNGLNKTIYLIKDECHQATNNLDKLIDKYFEKVFNFSATPKLSGRQVIDIEISDDDAVNARLIKAVSQQDFNATVEDAIIEYEKIKEDYRNMLGVNPCLIIQISNKDKGEEEAENIKRILNKAEHRDLKWMFIVNEDKNCETNDIIGNKTKNTKEWRKVAKESNSSIDIIVFKLTISEGWDIPRACMLYQIRDTNSKQLDEQVLGRVRRNPRLLDYQDLDEKAQELAMKCWVWGMVGKGTTVTVPVTVKPGTQDEVRLKTTYLKPLEKLDFDIDEYFNGKTINMVSDDIFSLYRNLQDKNTNIQQMAKEYSGNYQKWMLFAQNVDDISKKYEQYVCDYEKSMDIVKDDSGNDKYVSFPSESAYPDGEQNYVNIYDWVWKRDDEKTNFSFDSDAEKEWVEILKLLASQDLPTDRSKRAIKRNENPFGEECYLWGKNYLVGSDIKFEYYNQSNHFSYPDFIMKDSYNRFHIFEVKSVNKSSQFNIDENEYKEKIKQLGLCYKQASSLTGYVFYLPIKKDNDWQIKRYNKGEEDTITQQQLINFIKEKPND